MTETLVIRDSYLCELILLECSCELANFVIRLTSVIVNMQL